MDLATLKAACEEHRFKASIILGQGFYVYDDRNKLIVNISAGTTPSPYTTDQCWDLQFLLDKAEPALIRVVVNQLPLAVPNGRPVP